ncbi:MAG: NAD-dependent epimerase/dehydratase family protein [Deltaproteobacteria bacterium]|jgi:nucleoside-diphosphate-sugar epimerase|nr:NAD-dependent epimerase/dehydratase family protein [Deltaproteobacteria bacterium]
MKILVTGGKGFLGSHLVAGLVKDGEEVRIFAHKHQDTSKKELAEENVVWGDIRDQTVVEKAINGVDKVIHLVSNFRKGGSDKKEAYSINVEGTNNVLNAALKHKMNHFINAIDSFLNNSFKAFQKKLLGFYKSLERNACSWEQSA